VIEQVGLTPPRPDMLVKQLSGGNQQKVAVGKWFGGQPRVMMFDEATQGIDIKAKREVYDLVHHLCDRAAVIYASSDIDEVVGLADRVLVMKDGAVVADLSAAEADRQLILEYATGATSSGTRQPGPQVKES
jgi:simple sugar transport system ATP-binding protein